MRRVLAGLVLVATVLVAAPAQAEGPAGWTIRPRLVVDAAGYVHYSALPHCRNEDGSGQRSACTWNFHRRTAPDGNGRGRAYWVDRKNHVHYVKGWAR